MNTYAEFFEKVQGEILNSVKDAQDLNIKTLATLTNLVSTVPTVDTQDTTNVSMPTPVEFVERSFAFTNRLMDTRKEYLVKLAELATEAQKQFVDTAKRVAETAKN